MASIVRKAPARLAPVRADRPLLVRRYPLLLGLAGLLVGALLLVHVSIGTVDVPPGAILAVLARHTAGKLNTLLGWHLALPQAWAVDQLTNTVVWELRLPRALIA